MAKGFMPRGGGGANMQQLMRQAQKMQADMAAAQEKLAQSEYEATAGGGAVRAVVTGKKLLSVLEIKPEAADPEDVEMLQDMVIAAVNEALQKAEADSNEAMGKLTGGMNMPGLF
ncbi:MAG: YbaB/EbfC family nucleoid-associated protein [Eubacteriales bacterium]|nr:YbaB/EbfC family nucleoid-associated protein [Eubacteriales bacterium]